MSKLTRIIMAILVVSMATMAQADSNFVIPRDGNGITPLSYDFVGCTSTALGDPSTNYVTVTATTTRHVGKVMGLVISSGAIDAANLYVTLYDTHTKGLSSTGYPLVEQVLCKGTTSQFIWFEPPIPFRNGVSIVASSHIIDAAVVWVSSSMRPSFSMPSDGNGSTPQFYAMGPIQSQDIYHTTQAALIGSSMTTTGQSYSSLAAAPDMLLCGFQVSSGVAGTDYIEFRSSWVANVTSTKLLPRIGFPGLSDRVNFKYPIVCPKGCSVNISTAYARLKVFFIKRRN